MTNVIPVVLVHGGAGEVPEASRDAHREGCARAAEKGLVVLLAGGSALDAVQAAVRILEDDPLYNAGTGACLTRDGTLELDASIMEGTTLRAGAVTCLPAFVAPIDIARAVLEEGRHVLYAGEGAAHFARSAGFTAADPNAMITDAARARLAKVQSGVGDGSWAGGTVGAVACSAKGELAAATSTGGMVDKRPGRVGDSPILGAGTYADDLRGAASATGHGEAAMRLGITRLVCELILGGMTAQAAAERAIADLKYRVQGSGGLIVLSPLGDIGIAWNTATMTHAIAREGVPVKSGIVNRA